jgi:hypothetical protein
MMRPNVRSLDQLELELCETAVSNKENAPEEIADSIVACLQAARDQIQKAKEIVEDWTNNC